MSFFIWIYNRIGSLFCHQLPSRTLQANGILLPMCARDTGIYIGVSIASIYILVRGRFNANKPPRLILTVIFCLFMLPMFFDAISSYMGIRTTTNVIRLVTGMYFGAAIPFFLVPVANFKIYGRNDKEIIINEWELVFISLINLFMCLGIVNINHIPWILLSTLSVFGFLFLISRLIFTLIHRVTSLDSWNKIGAVAAGTVMFLFFMLLVSEFILQPLKNFLLKG